MFFFPESDFKEDEHFRHFLPKLAEGTEMQEINAVLQLRADEVGDNSHRRCPGMTLGSIRFYRNRKAGLQNRKNYAQSLSTYEGKLLNSEHILLRVLLYKPMIVQQKFNNIRNFTFTKGKLILILPGLRVKIHLQFRNIIKLNKLKKKN